MNELLDLLTFYIAEHGLEKLDLNKFMICDSINSEILDKENAHFDEEVLTRLANICPRISTINISQMDHLG